MDRRPSDGWSGRDASRPLVPMTPAGRSAWLGFSGTSPWRARLPERGCGNYPFEFVEGQVGMRSDVPGRAGTIEEIDRRAQMVRGLGQHMLIRRRMRVGHVSTERLLLTFR